MFMLFHTSHKRRPWLIAAFLTLLLAGWALLSLT